jgi:hypothetical protein
MTSIGPKAQGKSIMRLGLIGSLGGFKVHVQHNQ